MRRLLLPVSLMLLVAASAPPQRHSGAEQHGKDSGQSHQQETPPPPVPKPQNPKDDQSTEKPCKGTSRPDLSCDAISAQAALDQAADADAGFWLGTVQTVIGLATFGAAVAAAIFAKKAADHTKRSADVAEADQRPWLTFESDLIAENYAKGASLKDGVFLSIKGLVHNNGGVPAVGVRLRGFLSTDQSPDLAEAKQMIAQDVAYENVAKQNVLPHTPLPMSVAFFKYRNDIGDKPVTPIVYIVYRYAGSAEVHVTPYVLRFAGFFIGDVKIEGDDDRPPQTIKLEHSYMSIDPT